MAVKYAGWDSPGRHNTDIDVVGKFEKGYDFGKDVKDEQTAPDAFGKYLDALTGKPQATGLDALVGSSHQATAAAQDPTLTAYFNNIKAAESGGDPNAKNPRSSATGLYQAIKPTWDEYVQNRPDLGLTPDGRTDPEQNERFIRAFTGDNAKVLSKSGLPVNPGNLYAAHVLGAGGASKVLPMPDDTPMAAAVSPDVIQANPFMQNMTVGEFKQWSAQKGGGQNGGYQPPRQQQEQAQGGLPDRETMMALFKNSNTRPLAIELAKSAQAGTAPGKAASTVGKLAQDYRNGLIDQRTYDAALSKATAESKGVNVTTNIAEGDKFFDELDKKNAQMFSTLQENGVQAGASLIKIERMGQLLGQVDTGAGAAFAQIAGNFGIASEGLSDIQAAQAIINQLVPAQRPAGSGPMSDADLELFKQSLPRLINQPEGNQYIVDTMRGITQYTAEQGRIADLVANREVSPAQGRKMLAALENPIKALPKQSGPADALPNGVTEEDIQHTMQLHNVTREQVLERINAD